MSRSTWSINDTVMQTLPYIKNGKYNVYRTGQLISKMRRIKNTIKNKKNFNVFEEFIMKYEKVHLCKLNKKMVLN